MTAGPAEPSRGIPDRSPGRRGTAADIRLVFAWTLVGAVLWNAAIFAAPLLMRSSPAWGKLWYAAFAPVCHQDPARCFVLAGFPLAVCGRCLGIYLGFLAGAAAYPLLRGFSAAWTPRLRTLIGFSLPMAADALGNLLGLWRSPTALRFATGACWGVILPFYWIPGLADVVSVWRGGRRPPRKPRPSSCFSGGDDL